MTSPVIELFPGADSHPFASMMVALIRANLEDHPSKLLDFHKMQGRVALVAEDANTAVTLRFHGGKMTVHPGVSGIPDLVVRGPSEALINLSRVPPHRRWAFLPDPRSEAAEALVAAFRDGSLKLYGFVAHAGLGLRLSRVMSIY